MAVLCSAISSSVKAASRSLSVSSSADSEEPGIQSWWFIGRSVVESDEASEAGAGETRRRLGSSSSSDRGPATLMIWSSDVL